MSAQQTTSLAFEEETKVEKVLIKLNAEWEHDGTVYDAGTQLRVNPELAKRLVADKIAQLYDPELEEKARLAAEKALEEKKQLISEAVTAAVTTVKAELQKDVEHVAPITDGQTIDRLDEPETGVFPCSFLGADNVRCGGFPPYLGFACVCFVGVQVYNLRRDRRGLHQPRGLLRPNDYCINGFCGKVILE